MKQLLILITILLGACAPEEIHHETFKGGNQRAGFEPVATKTNPNNQPTKQKTSGIKMLDENGNIVPLEILIHKEEDYRSYTENMRKYSYLYQIQTNTVLFGYRKQLEEIRKKGFNGGISYEDWPVFSIDSCPKLSWYSPPTHGYVYGLTYKNIKDPQERERVRRYECKRDHMTSNWYRLKSKHDRYKCHWQNQVDYVIVAKKIIKHAIEKEGYKPIKNIAGLLNKRFPIYDISEKRKQEYKTRIFPKSCVGK